MLMQNPRTGEAASATDSRDRLAGIALMCAALMCFACLDASAKWLNRHMDPMQTVWVRYVASIVLVGAAINPVTRPGVMRSARPWLQTGRSLLLFLSTALNFFALLYLQLAETMSIIFSTPLLVALIAGPLLGEWVGPRRLAAIAVGFLGVLVVARPGLGGLHPAALLSMAGAVCYALYNISTRVLAAHDSSETTMVYSGLAGVALTTPLIPFIWTTPASPVAWLIMGGLGAFGALGHWLLIQAHRRAPAAVLAPFIYTQIVWMIGLGFVIFGDVPDVYTLAGGGIVIASGLYLLYRERVVAKPTREA
ncbi:DMT family transporter [Chelatococcus sp. SYSU_G07232]|uniref:DMT family transporter n=1 Tax=Chelatococcus albus TaxID=3047466 RepID=A0ABT7AG90_9HYPH|nr:DMT family transporter [Chelatococcus sp. SYSU_G07232]MDJ1158374.1 DMT family transporter [Chelatococcus sp. SYSU_G07232]